MCVMCRHRRMSDFLRLVNSPTVDVVSPASSCVQCHVISSCQHISVAEMSPAITVTVADNYWR